MQYWGFLSMCIMQQSSKPCLHIYCSTVLDNKKPHVALLLSEVQVLQIYYGYQTYTCL